jgi:hypothetical protein
LKPSSLTRKTPPQPPRRRCLHIRLAPPPILVCLEPAAPSLLFSAFARRPPTKLSLAPSAYQSLVSCTSPPTVCPGFSQRLVARPLRPTPAARLLPAISAPGARSAPVSPVLLAQSPLLARVEPCLFSAIFFLPLYDPEPTRALSTLVCASPSARRPVTPTQRPVCSFSHTVLQRLICRPTVHS